LFGDLRHPLVLHALLGAIGFCLIGAIDDVLKLTRMRRADGPKSGISARGKMALQVAVSAALAYALLTTVNGSVADAVERRELFSFDVPFMGWSIDLSAAGGWPWMVACTLIMVGTSNAVNLTDGLDGLAPGCIVLASAAFAILAYAVGRSDSASNVTIAHVDGAEEMAVVAAALAGAGVAFLWFNAHPAQVFLGDTGSLALGGLLGYIACATSQELVLPLIGGVFLAEALSVILQVASFKSRGKRIFRCAPLHHHFQFGGMHEVKIVIRFWIVAGLCALAGLATLVVR
jgi:phospho-N-acetylmuramoyl-pentapeptide-transferase